MAEPWWTETAERKEGSSVTIGARTLRPIAQLQRRTLGIWSLARIVPVEVIVEENETRQRISIDNGLPAEIAYSMKIALLVSGACLALMLGVSALARLIR